MEECSKLWEIIFILVLFSRFDLFPQVYGHVHEWLILKLREIIRVLYAVACPIVLFCFMIEIGREECTNLWKMNNFNIFSRLGFFPHVFGQVKEWLMLKFHKIRKVSLVFACPVVFLWFYERGGQKGVLKVMKGNHFLVFLAVWVLFPKFFGRKRSDLC